MQELVKNFEFGVEPITRSWAQLGLFRVNNKILITSTEDVVFSSEFVC